jgi:hypothetical protein
MRLIIFVLLLLTILMIPNQHGTTGIRLVNNYLESDFETEQDDAELLEFERGYNESH